MISRFSELSLLSFNEILQKIERSLSSCVFWIIQGTRNSTEHKLTAFPDFLPLKRINRAVAKLLIKAVHWDENLTANLPSVISSACVPDQERVVHINSPTQSL